MSVGDRPRSDELEISLFGPGVGECVVVHLGEDEWLIVDSCINPTTREPAALEYLSTLGVKVESAVRYVVVSHWHDDHTRGMSRVLEAATSAEFVCSTALSRKEFTQLIAASRSLNLKDDELSGVDELDKVLDIVRSRRTTRRAVDAGPRMAHADTLVHRRAAGATPECEVFALSPSSSTLARAFHEIAELLPKLGATKRAIVNLAPNDTALVLGVRFGDAVAVLGSDLEAGSSDAVGWGAVLTTKSCPRGRANVFKVPHHGSDNAHHPGQWTTLLSQRPLAILTPYATGKKPLPTEADVARLKQQASAVYVTAPPPAKASAADAMVQRTMNEVAKLVRTRGVRLGHVRVRLSASSSTPRVETFGAAFAA